MRVGFTGTREGMTIAQWATVATKIAGALSVEELNYWHDGDCVGADHQAHQSVANMKKAGVPIQMHGHPCNLDAKYRAYNDFDFMHETLPPLVRNRDIVNASELMFAAPKEYEEVLRGSGTWATIRYAVKQNVELIVVWPDGNYSTGREALGA